MMKKLFLVIICVLMTGCNSYRNAEENDKLISMFKDKILKGMTSEDVEIILEESNIRYRFIEKEFLRNSLIPSKEKLIHENICGMYSASLKYEGRVFTNDKVNKFSILINCNGYVDTVHTIEIYTNM